MENMGSILQNMPQASRLINNHLCHSKLFKILLLDLKFLYVKSYFNESLTKQVLWDQSR